LVQCGLPPPPPLLPPELLAPELEDGEGDDALEDVPPVLDAPPRDPPVVDPPSLNARWVVTERGTLGGATAGRGGAGAALLRPGTVVEASRPFARSDAGGTCAVALPTRLGSGEILALSCSASAAGERLEFTKRPSVRSKTIVDPRSPVPARDPLAPAAAMVRDTRAGAVTSVS